MAKHRRELKLAPVQGEMLRILEDSGGSLEFTSLLNTLAHWLEPLPGVPGSAEVKTYYIDQLMALRALALVEIRAERPRGKWSPIWYSSARPSFVIYAPPHAPDRSSWGRLGSRPRRPAARGHPCLPAGQQDRADPEERARRASTRIRRVRVSGYGLDSEVAGSSMERVKDYDTKIAREAGPECRRVLE